MLRQVYAPETIVTVVHIVAVIRVPGISAKIHEGAIVGFNRCIHFINKLGFESAHGRIHHVQPLPSGKLAVFAVFGGNNDIKAVVTIL
jgi:hypothetical protein